MQKQVLSKAKAQYLSNLIPERYRTENLSWENVNPANKTVFDDSISSLFTKYPKGIVLTGAVGTGKTSMCCLGLETLADRLIESFNQRYKINANANVETLPDKYANWFSSKMTVLYTTEFQLIRKINQWMKGKDVWNWEDHVKYDLIILDDFGRSHRTDWSRTILDEFIDWTYSHRIPIWLSTNYHYEALNEMRSSESTSEYKRIADRLLDPIWTTQLSTGNESKRRSDASRLTDEPEREKT